MISESVLELLTAFVDGELSNRQRKAVTRVLAKSSEARDTLKQLQENAHKLKQLPRHKVEPSLVEPVLNAIAAQQTQPSQIVMQRRPRTGYVGWSLAACLVVGAAWFGIWRITEGPTPAPAEDKDPIAKNEKPQPETKQTPPPLPGKQES